MRPLVKRTLLGLAALGLFVGGYLFGATITSLLPGPGRPPIDLSEGISAKDPKGKTEAVLLLGSDREPFNFLGSDKKAYLGLKLNGTTVILNKDLLEGNGTYESAIRSIKWLDGDRVLVERTIQDRESNIEFNVKKMKWQNVQ